MEIKVIQPTCAKLEKVNNRTSLGVMAIITIAINMVTHLTNVGQSLQATIRRQNSKDFVKTAIDMDIVLTNVGLKRETTCGVHTEKIMEVTKHPEVLIDSMIEYHGITTQRYVVKFVEDMDT